MTDFPELPKPAISMSDYVQKVTAKPVQTGCLDYGVIKNQIQVTQNNQAYNSSYQNHLHSYPQQKENIQLHQTHYIDSQGQLEDGYEIQQFAYQERYRVDRQRLEQIILNPQHFTNSNSIEDYFAKVEKETGAVVIWPTKLKVGAKTKRDPFLRIGGEQSSVIQAREKISQVLQIKGNSRIILKIEMSYTDHSHIIGKGGSTIRKIKEDTKCHIHFPDGNIRKSPEEKSNQVSISGDEIDVERARNVLRSLSPVNLQLHLPSRNTFKKGQISAVMMKIQNQFGLEVQQDSRDFHISIKGFRNVT